MCRSLLKPVARLLLHCGVPWKEFAEIAKSAFVTVATEEFGLRGRPTNVSRVAILTGLGRREVRKQREATARAEPIPTYLSAASRVLSGWHQDQDFLDASGSPLELPPLGAERRDNGIATFQELWRRYGGDVPVGALLKELIAAGSVRESAARRLQVIARNYIPRQFDTQKMLRAGGVFEDFGNTVVHDLTCAAEEPLRFERRATHALVDARALPEFRELLEREGQALLERIDAWLTAHAVPESDLAIRRSVRLGAGLYHIQDQGSRQARR